VEGFRVQHSYYRRGLIVLKIRLLYIHTYKHLVQKIYYNKLYYDKKVKKTKQKETKKERRREQTFLFKGY